MNNVPNINKVGAAERPNKKTNWGPRGSKGGGSILANSLEIIYVYGFFFAPKKTHIRTGALKNKNVDTKTQQMWVMGFPSA